MHLLVSNWNCLEERWIISATGARPILAVAVREEKP